MKTKEIEKLKDEVNLLIENYSRLADRIWRIENPARFKRFDKVHITRRVGMIRYDNILEYDGQIMGLSNESHKGRLYYVAPVGEGNDVYIESESDITPRS